MTTPENPSPQDPPDPKPGGDGEGEGERVDPQEALRGLGDRPRIDDQGNPTAYTAVPPPLYGQNQGEGRDEGPEQPEQHGREHGPDAPGGGWNQGPDAGWQQPDHGWGPEYGRAPAGAQPGYAAQHEQNPYGQQHPGYGYPPPAPGYDDPYGSPYGGGPVPGMPPLANWGQRAAAWLIDNLLAVIGLSILDASYYDWGSGPRAAGWVLALVGVFWSILNAYRAGRSGQSAGKRIAGIRLARYLDGQVVGPAFGVLRLFMNVVFWAICVIPGVLNYLWPLWDRKSQTWSDKIASSVVVRAR